jgi:diguanylate cyclase
MERLMQILEPRSLGAIVLRVIFFTACIALVHLMFHWFIGPFLPQNTLLFQLANATVVGAPFLWFFFSVMMYQVRLQRRLSRLSRKDSLTGLNNRRSFFEMAEKRRKQAQVAILMVLDADHFKRINDTYGHQAGDICLQTIAYTLRRNLRAQDVVGRIGGEEFAILLANTTEAQARVIAERLTGPIPFQAGPEAAHLSVTLSVGAVASTPDIALDRLFIQADRALYQAKSEGRARVVFAGSDQPPPALQLAV